MIDLRIKVSNIEQLAHIEVDRSGTKAAVATYVDLCFGSFLGFEETKRVILDRPFIYAIMHNETAQPIFAGVVNKL